MKTKDQKKRSSDVYFNYGDEPIWIVSKITVDPSGGPAIWDKNHTICIFPGAGIDFKCLTLSKQKPTKRRMKCV